MASPELHALEATIAPLRSRLAEHPLYTSFQTMEDLQLFMESHVFAVWDFMSLLKALQHELTCTTIPWKPTADARSRRLINEIVLGEESDEYEGRALSHFELYLEAMQACGADSGPMTRLLQLMRQGLLLDEALERSGAPPAAIAFVERTFSILDRAKPHEIAAAFTFGREDLIPDLFQGFVRAMDERFPGQLTIFRYYLERHIEIDSGEHGPMALEMVENLCHSENDWAEATAAAIEALTARLQLWEALYLQAVEIGSAG